MVSIRRAARALAAPERLLCAALLLVIALLPIQALADDKAKLFATNEKGFGRLILDFPARLDLPPYKIRAENGVLSLEFQSPIDFTLPDVAAALPTYVTIARIDPDRKGLRFGLRTTLTLNHMEAGEQLFVDLMPTNWQGLPPGLPPTVVASLSERAKQAAILAEQNRKVEEAKINRPVAELRVGRNPTFMRLEFDWNVDTEAKFALDGTTGKLQFDWPVPIDLSAFKADLPPEIKGVDNVVAADGSGVVLHAADGVVPRFYALSNRLFVVDIDIASSVPASVDPETAATAKAVADANAAVEASAAATPGSAGPADNRSAMVAVPQGPITPVVTNAEGTLRVTFPFAYDTAAAVFRRGDTLWMLFDTLTGINQPAFSEDLASLAKAFTIVPAGDTQVVRIDLGTDKLATLGSEGRSWVLSLGDNLLTPTEPLSFDRRQDKNGLYQVTADLERPARVHQFRDPIVGDLLTVVTALPPARGSTRDLSFVDFDALRSIHGLVVKPEHDDVGVDIEAKLAVISTPGGLTVSPPDPTRGLAADGGKISRAGFIDLASFKEDDPVKLAARGQSMMAIAAGDEGKARDQARLDLARLYAANQFSYESIGVLDVLGQELKTPELQNEVQMTLAVADTLAARPADALKILNSTQFSDEVDAQIWRSIAKAEGHDYRGARSDAMASEAVLDTYPGWIKNKFLLSGIRAAVETDDTALAERYLKLVEFAKLDPEQVTDFQVLSGRVAEAENRLDEALDTYGQVIAADLRPTRAEAVYRTILILNQTGKVDLAKATRTLASEALLWRGNPLEADMDRLLAELYFRDHNYREGFQTVKATVQNFPESAALDALTERAQGVFSELYLNGAADALGPVDALSLYYDFRNLTPPGAQGDEMIRNLARRLVKVDLLSQAADLLQYQIDSRLKGAAQAQIATELAVIQIADRKPEAALKVLNNTNLADLSPALDRQRRILEARALIDANRNDLALDLLTAVQGRDADLLRVEAYWNGKAYDQAGAALEVIYSPDGSADLLSQPARMNIVKAGVAFALAGDDIGLSRLRSKFSDPMAKSAEWPMFDYVTSKIMTPASAEFKVVAQAVSGVDSLDAFLASYHQAYGADGGLTPASAAKPGVAAADAGAAPGVNAAKAG